jgi:hypothetical protein
LLTLIRYKIPPSSRCRFLNTFCHSHSHSHSGSSWIQYCQSILPSLTPAALMPAKMALGFYSTATISSSSFSFPLSHIPPFDFHCISYPRVQAPP